MREGRLECRGGWQPLTGPAAWEARYVRSNPSCCGQHDCKPQRPWLPFNTPAPPPTRKPCRQTLGAAGIQANDLLMLLRRVPAGAARAAQQGGGAQPAAAQQAAGNPVAQNPDGSAINPELMMQVMQG